MAAPSNPASSPSTWDLVCDAAANLHSLSQRSLLGLLGIAIGTASVVALLTIGHMAEREAMNVFRASGANMLLLRLTPKNNAAPVPYQMQIAKAVLSQHLEITSLESLTAGAGTAYFYNRSAPAGLVALLPRIQNISGLQLRSGRLLTSVERNELVAVVGSNLLKKLSDGGMALSLGDEIRISGYVFKVVGVLEPRALTAYDPVDYNDSVIVSSGSKARVFEYSSENSAILRLRDDVDPSAEADWIATRVQSALPQTTVEVSNPAQYIQAMKAEKDIQIRLLAAIGAVSLLVGGVGIMNIMLMNAIERRREIGLRAAVGASPYDIRAMFVAEAAILSCGGGIAGTVLGLCIAWAVALASSWAFSVALYALPLGVGLATAIGIVSGAYPAMKASQLDPVEALRAD